ncbi:unnamed protein product [Citrullus colocynthis]|uniref:Uncharacterized protein n=1 Tax=Citrullus colocynthis TaxID=252529 RepID=A0ABP0YDH4_9ROSI
MVCLSAARRHSSAANFLFRSLIVSSSREAFVVSLILLLKKEAAFFAHRFSESPLKSLRYLSTSSEIVSSVKSASLASNLVQLKNNENLVLIFFENHGFSKPQISEIVKKFPQDLSAKPEKTILLYQPRVFLVSSIRFKEIVEEVKEMGFNPLRLKFVLAVFALRAMSKSTWDKKIGVYRKWGMA